MKWERERETAEKEMNKWSKNWWKGGTDGEIEMRKKRGTRGTIEGEKNEKRIEEWRQNSIKKENGWLMMENKKIKRTNNINRHFKNKEVKEMLLFLINGINVSVSE